MSLVNMNCVFTFNKNKLYLGNIRSAQNNTHQLRAIISVLETRPKVSDCHHKWIPAEDTVDFKLSRYFDDAADFIHQHLSSGNVLVHCYAGISRSASVVIAYLMKYHTMSLIQATRTVQNNRSIIQPNKGFLKQLKDYELKVRNVKSYLTENLSPKRQLQSPKQSISSPKSSRSFLNKKYKTLFV